MSIFINFGPKAKIPMFSKYKRKLKQFAKAISDQFETHTP